MLAIFAKPNVSFRALTTTLMSSTLLAVATIGLSSALPASTAFAQEEGRQFNAKSGEKVNEALTAANAGNNQLAVNILNETLSWPDLNPYERSTMYQMLGQYSNELDRLGDSLRAFENAISAGGLLPNEVENIKVVIAQLMIANGQYAEGAQRLENYINSGGQRKDNLSLIHI